MMFFVGSLIILFILASALPLLQWYLTNKKEKEVIDYIFPTELIDHSPYRSDDDTSATVDRRSLQYRGSVRMARGSVLTKKGFEEKKAKIYSVSLP